MQLPLGELCTACKRVIERRARKIALGASVVTTGLVALNVFSNMPNDSQARVVGMVGLFATFVLTNVIVLRAMREWKR